MVQNNLIKLVATDLDGTLLCDDKTISTIDMESLKSLSKSNIVRVAATGRSMHKVFEVLPEDVPFDFIVFSSGGGIFDWNRKKLLTSEKFEKNTAHEIFFFLLKRNLHFFVFRPIPENNCFQYYEGAGENDEFNNYLKRHIGDFSVLDKSNLPNLAGQFMVIIPNDEVLFESIKSGIIAECKGIMVIRTTSPVNSMFIWLEIFPVSVSKGHGLKWLCDFLAIAYDQTVGIGNDFNDQDMFDFVSIPYLLGNSPNSLLKKYPSVSETNNQSGFSKVLEVIGI